MPIESPPATLGAAMPAFLLPSVEDGAGVSSTALAGAPSLVMFICNHCPYVKAVEDRVIALARRFGPLGVRFLAIAANDAAAYPDDAPSALAERARDKGYGFPYLFDETQAVARAFDAVCTPEFFLYDRAQRLAYHGRLDDSPRDPSKVTRQELALAIEAVLADRAVEGPQRPAIGCSIKWRD